MEYAGCWAAMLRVPLSASVEVSVTEPVLAPAMRGA